MEGVDALLLSMSKLRPLLVGFLVYLLKIPGEHWTWIRVEDKPLEQKTRATPRFDDASCCDRARRRFLQRCAVTFPVAAGAPRW